MYSIDQNAQTDLALKDWREKEKSALELSKLVGDLRFDRSIELVIFRKDLHAVTEIKIGSEWLALDNRTLVLTSIESRKADYQRSSSFRPKEEVVSLFGKTQPVFFGAIPTS